MRIIKSIVFIFLLSLSRAMAHNPIAMPFGPFEFSYIRYPNDNADYYNFHRLCEKKKYNEKEISKVRAAYEQLKMDNLKLFIGNVCHQLGHAYLQGVGTEQDFDVAFTYYRLEYEYLGASRNNKKTGQMELHNNQRSWFTAQKELKVILQELQISRSNAAKVGGNLPKGMTEMNVENCV